MLNGFFGLCCTGAGLTTIDTSCSPGGTSGGAIPVIVWSALTWMRARMSSMAALLTLAARLGSILSDAYSRGRIKGLYPLDCRASCLYVIACNRAVGAGRPSGRKLG